MYPVPFEYHRAGSVDEAVALLARYGESGKLLAGGHSLLPLMKLRLAEPGHLVDIRRIPGLSGVREEGGALIIGAATPHQDLVKSPLVRERLPILSEAAAQIGDAQVRNMGTIGGSMAHADPAADLPAVMLALGAELVVVGPKGRRAIPVDRFFVKLFTTALSAGRATHGGACSAPGRGLGRRLREVPASGFPLRGGGRGGAGHRLRPEDLGGAGGDHGSGRRRRCGPRRRRRPSWARRSTRAWWPRRRNALPTGSPFAPTRAWIPSTGER